MEFANYLGEKTIKRVSAIEVDSDLEKFDRRVFRCIFCGSQVEFSHGTHYPLFRRWKGIDHEPDCIYDNISNPNRRSNSNNDVDLLVSTILPRAMTFPSSGTTPTEHRESNIARHFSGKRTRLFISSVKKLLDPKRNYYFAEDYENMQILAETGEKFCLKDLIGSQDEIIEKIDNSPDNAVVCILKGNTRIPKPTAGGHIRIPFSTSGKHMNTKNFALFIPSDYVPKNTGRIKEIEETFVICYGIAEKNKYGYQMTIFSIYHQIEVLKKY